MFKTPLKKPSKSELKRISVAPFRGICAPPESKKSSPPPSLFEEGQIHHSELYKLSTAAIDMLAF